MYPHIITIFHKESDKNGDSYFKYVIDGVYVNNNNQLRVSNTSFTLDCPTRISVNKENFESFGLSWKLTEGDKIVKGISDVEIGNDFRFSLIEDAWTVEGIKINEANSVLNGMVIDCK